VALRGTLAQAANRAARLFAGINYFKIAESSGALS